MMPSPGLMLFFFLTKSGQWKTMETRVHLDPSFIFVILQKKETYAQKRHPKHL